MYRDNDEESDGMWEEIAIVGLILVAILITHFDDKIGDFISLLL